MFEALTERLQAVFRGLSRRGKLSQGDVDDALREIRLALLEADVHYQVVRDLVDRVRGRASGQEVSRALNPAQQVVKIVRQELIASLGEPGRLRFAGPRPWAVMLVGLQGSGKTTTAAKLARWLRSRGERVWLVAADPYRPAAIEQLVTLGQEIDVPVFSEPSLAPPELCAAAVAAGGKAGASVIILDTAGRSQLDDVMMDELAALGGMIHPTEVLLVADAMTGQEAVNIALGFQGRLALTGLILTKMDGDARGGAAISMRAVTGVSIIFVGTGESREALEPFEPERLASRILGMGDVLSLIEQAEATFDQEESQRQIQRITRGEFTLEDYAEQLAQIRRMGPLGKVLDMLPVGMAGRASNVDTQQAERQLVRTEAILRSMTPLERRKPDVLNASRKRRVAAGSGTTVQEVNQILRQYQQMRRMFKQTKKRGLGGFPPGLR
jgi:signal recognition particle subunit SRP54